MNHMYYLYIGIHYILYIHAYKLLYVQHCTKGLTFALCMWESMCIFMLHNAGQCQCTLVSAVVSLMVRLRAYGCIYSAMRGLCVRMRQPCEASSLGCGRVFMRFPICFTVESPFTEFRKTVAPVFFPPSCVGSLLTQATIYSHLKIGRSTVEQ